MRFVQRLVVSLLAVVMLAGAGGASAAAGSTGSIKVCVKRSSGALYLPEVKCAKRDKSLSWSLHGPAGLPGPQGPKGETGATGPAGPQGPAGSSYSAGKGLTLSGSTFASDFSLVQARVSGAPCPTGQAITNIAQSGAATCTALGGGGGGASGWSLTGNAGTSPASNYLGTSDNQPLNLDVNGQRALQLQPTTGIPNVIAGSSSNRVSSGVQGATISGGGAPNEVTGDFGTVAGGAGNTAGVYATASGSGNAAIGSDSTALGSDNVATGFAAVAVGVGNRASGDASTALGHSNTASAPNSVAAGFFMNVGGDSSIGLGKSGLIRSGDDDSFLFSDGTMGPSGQPFQTTNSHEFSALATNGFNFELSAPFATYAGCYLNSSSSGWNCVSDRNAKHAFAKINDQAILRALERMPIRSWTYNLDRTGTRHIGPTAQDFAAAFHVGNNPKAIGMLDESGIALAGEKGLYQLVRSQHVDLQRQQSLLRRQQAQLQRQQAEMTGLQRELAALERSRR